VKYTLGAEKIHISPDKGAIEGKKSAPRDW